MVGVFILPPDLPELERRLRGRAQDPEEIVRYRLAQVASDVTHWPEYDYVLVNKEFDASVAAVRAILAAERLRRKRQPGLDRVRRAVPGGAATTEATMLAAMDLAADHQLSIWDAVILAAAAETGCRLVFPRTCGTGSPRGLTVANPFADQRHALFKPSLRPQK